MSAEDTRGMAEDAEYWRDLARYDLETARVMLRSRRYAYVLFTCQQAVEKMLKAAVVLATGAIPPRTHNLPRLAQLAELELTQQQQDFLTRLDTFYIEARYPSERPAASQRINRQMAVSYLEETREIFAWLASQLE